MNISRELLEVRVEAPFACFTRPELKAERVSYPVMTPSAARGVLEAIYWRPQFFWRVEEIWVLKPIRYFSIVRNEVAERASTSRIIIADMSRMPRHTLALRDVTYRIRARIVLIPEADHPLPKYVETFERRVTKGQCFATPYLGCREFSAAFGPINPEEQSIQRSEDLGRMLHDLVYETNGTGRAIPRFFDARLESGILHVPPFVRGAS
jgi:CRISPR-associated protein Cas5d